ncbi:Nucleoside phosphorylase [Penicillium brevicompactum]
MKRQRTDGHPSPTNKKRETESRSHHDYTVGWICALPKEYVAAVAMLDERHPDLPRTPNDHNTYTLGHIEVIREANDVTRYLGKHNIVVACLPKGNVGTNNAATVATRMTSTFPSIKFGLMVGIGGGVPNSVRLGDVVVSTPGQIYGGVVQWDFGKANQGDNNFERTGSLNSPPKELLSALSTIEREHEMTGSRIPEYLDDLKIRWPKLAPKYCRSDSLKDVLFKADCEHIDNPSAEEDKDNGEEDEDEEEEEEEGESCMYCDQSNILRRKPRSMRVHYGLIASGNRVVKDALFRNEVNKELGGKVLCFEMEAAGLMNDFPCLVIRGICDYADAHKNKKWQRHAAAVAAAFTKELLTFVPVQEVEQMPAIKDLQSRLQKVSNTVDEIRLHQHDHQRDQEFQTVLDWLSPVNYAAQQNDSISQRQEGTSIPGSGKTIITSTVVRHIQDKFRDDRSVGIAYVYCTFKQREEQKPVDLMANILKQLAMRQDVLPSALESLYRRLKSLQARPSLIELRTTLRGVASLYSKTFIIIDALDECRTVGDDLDTFVQEIFAFQDGVKANLFATSRKIEQIESKFQAATKIEIRANDEDVKKYLDKRLQDSQSLSSQGAPLKQNIKDTISKAVDGMFLLARLYIDSLACKITPKAIKQTLRELDTMSQANNDDARSKVLDNAYEGAMERIQNQVKDRRDLALQVLLWISCAERRLTSTELQHAIGVEENTSEFDNENISDIGLIVSTSAGLVIVDKESDIIRLVHHTTQEYFQRTSQRWFPEAHLQMTKVCIVYLRFEDFKSGECDDKWTYEERLRLHPFYEYASTEWGYHAAKSALAQELAIELFKDTAKIAACTQVMRSRYGTFYSDPSKMTGLHLSAWFGLYETASLLLDMRNIVGSQISPPPPEFSANDINIECRDHLQQTPLHYAAFWGYEAVVKLLLVNGAEIESRDYIQQTPFCGAANNGKEAVVKLLLENGAQIDTRDSNNRTPLSHAAESGHDFGVKLLLEHNADIKSRDMYNQTPLFHAAISGQEEVVQLLLARNASLECRDTHNQTPLTRAAENGHDAMVKLLLANNAETETRDINGRTPLAYASENGHQSVVNLLLEQNSDTESRDKNGQTALSLAAENGHETVVKLLLEHNGQIESQDKNNQVPLDYAAWNGHTTVIKLLLAHGAKSDHRDNQDRTPLHSAAENGHEAVVELLLEQHNMNPDYQDNEGWIPLHSAASHGHEAVVKLLLEYGAEIDCRNMDGLTPLHSAADCGHVAAMKLLLEQHNIQPDYQDNKGWIPLHFAAQDGHEAVVKLLLEHGAKIDCRNMDGMTPLHFATQYGHEAVVKLLLCRDAEIDCRTMDGLTPLHLATQHGHEAVVKLLLGRDAEIDCPSNTGCTPLHLAAEWGCVAEAKLLLEYNADVEVTNSDGMTPLSVVKKLSLAGEKTEGWEGWDGVIELLLQRASRGS